MTQSWASVGLLGRRAECLVLDALVDDVRGGRSGALVLRGEPGIGKSALLERVLASAHGCATATASGFESEMELAFSGLHQLCGPFLDGVDRLPEVQRDALRTAFGMAHGMAPDRFLVGLAVLTLLAGAASDRPLICVVDDAQWLDRSSSQTLAFVARRLLAERIGVIFATRETSDDDLSGLPELSLRGLSRDDSGLLLDRANPGLLDERIRTRILSEARGNPLALLELPRQMADTDLSDGFGLGTNRPVTHDVEVAFQQRLAPLSPSARRLLLAAAADPVGDAALMWRAADQLGIGADAASEAESAGLIQVGARVRFRHPLLRAVVYRTANDADRMLVHGALADATDSALDPEGRAWHRAYAVAGPDSRVADELEQSAVHVRARGGVSAAAAFLERASELTPEPDRRAARALGAAEARFRSGSTDSANELLTSAELATVGDPHRARVDRLRAQLLVAQGRIQEAGEPLLDVARRLDADGDPSARDTYLEALATAIFAGRLAREGTLERAARAVLSARPSSEPQGVMDLLLDGLARRFTQGYTAALPDLRRALAAFRAEADRDVEGIMRWLWLACPVAPEPIAPDLWDEESSYELSVRAVELARAVGALSVLPQALSYRAGVHIHSGEFAEADELLAEADRIALATGSARLSYTRLVLVAWSGDEAAATRLIERSVNQATANGEGRALGLAQHVTAVLHNGLGHYPDALQAARSACAYEDVGFYGSALAELVEAAARTGERAAAADALARLEERTAAAGTNWALGTLQRSQALLTQGPEAQRHYQEAIERLKASRAALQLARTHLLYGEWLRRENRRPEAREELREAHGMFERFGARAFARRAGNELAATGETPSRPPAQRRDALTAQEAQIARLASTGLTNPEIATQLFLSPHTVEWHLRKVFAKLGIGSRRQLTSALAMSSPEG